MKTHSSQTKSSLVYTIGALVAGLGLLYRVVGRRRTESDRWPGVQQAYDIARDSYASLVQRLDAVDSRIQSLQTYAASIALAVPTIVAAINKTADFSSHWFFAAMTAFAGIVIIGAIARAFGSVTVVSPDVLFEKWLGYSEWEFKKNYIYWAGEHFKKNASLVNKKGNIAILLTALFLAEAVLLTYWAASQL